MFDGFLTEDGQTWVTLASVANGLELNRQTPRNWVAIYVEAYFSAILSPTLSRRGMYKP